jgi:hypothetical protein
MKIDSKYWEFTSTGHGAPYQGSMSARKYSMYGHAIGSSGTIALETAMSTDGPWVLAITLSTSFQTLSVQANSANYLQYEGPLLAVRPRLQNLGVSTGSVRVQLVSVD